MRDTPGARTQISRSIMTVLLLWTGCPTHGAEPLPVTIIQRKMSLSSSPLGPLLLLLLGCATKCTATGWSGAAQWDFWTSGGCPGSAQATQTDSSKMSGAGLRTDDRRWNDPILLRKHHVLLQRRVGYVHHQKLRLN